MPRGVRMNPQASSSSIGELLRDPHAAQTPLPPDISTPSSRKSRPATAPVSGNTHISDVLNGESERTSGAHLRRLHGCDVHCHDGRSTKTGRKNMTSIADSEIAFRKGKATVSAGKNETTFASTNTVLGPDSGPEGDRQPKKMFGRMTHHNGDIIRAPPSVEWEDKRRAKNAAAGAAHKSRQHHGDIISGRDQNLLQGTGKSKSALGVSRANQGTLGLLHWHDGGGKDGSPSRGRANGSSKNQSAQMMDAMSGSARAPKADPPPRGQSHIDRLALGTAFAVIAPRDNAQGKGIADLRT